MNPGNFWFLLEKQACSQDCFLWGGIKTKIKKSGPFGPIGFFEPNPHFNLLQKTHLWTHSEAKSGYFDRFGMEESVS